MDRLLQARAPRPSTPTCSDLFWKATKTAGEAKKTNDEAVGQRLLDEIDRIAEIFWETKKA